MPRSTSVSNACETHTGRSRGYECHPVRRSHFTLKPKPCAGDCKPECVLLAPGALGPRRHPTSRRRGPPFPRRPRAPSDANQGRCRGVRSARTIDERCLDPSPRHRSSAPCFLRGHVCSEQELGRSVTCRASRLAPEQRRPRGVGVAGHHVVVLVQELCPREGGRAAVQALERAQVQALLRADPQAAAATPRRKRALRCQVRSRQNYTANAMF